MLVESIVPLDFYSNIVGALIDQKVLQILLRERLPDLCEHFDDVGLELSFLAHQWIICLLGCNLPQSVSNRIWDLLFLRG